MIEAKLVKQLTNEFETENPYTPVQSRGSLFLPVEASLEGHPGRASDDEDSGDDDTQDSAKAGSGSATHESNDVSPVDQGSSAGGLVWKVTVRPDNFNDPKHCTASGELKSRRPVPQIKVSELLRGLTQRGGRWIFDATLNGWPALAGLELRSISRDRKRVFQSSQFIWRADKDAVLPEASAVRQSGFATFVSPPWIARGWSPSSPGFVLWFTAQRPGGPRLMYGEEMVARLEGDPDGVAKATTVHSFAHRYPVETESLRDRQTWHTGVLLEWSHGLYTTVIELAWKDGLGGYGGKSNWVEDKLAPMPKLYEAMPVSMKSPWNPKRAEARLIDMPARSKQEFEAYLHKYSNSSGLPLEQQRFLEPKVYASSNVRLRCCSQAEIAGHLLNYIHRTFKYEELSANCQTFTADVFAFLAGSKGVQPFGMISRPRYQQRTFSFLYVP